jgi:hypothetical protein
MWQKREMREEKKAKKKKVTSDTLELCFLHTWYHLKDIDEMILTTL